MAMMTQKPRNSAKKIAYGFRVEGMRKSIWSVSRNHLMPLRVSGKGVMALEQRRILITDRESRFLRMTKGTRNLCS